MVQHRQLNLLHDFSQRGAFDIIFCRNVLIYFDQDTKINIFGRLAKAMEGDGFLVLGAAEMVVGLTDVFKRAVPGQGQRSLSAERRACRVSARVDAKNRRDGGTVSDDRGRQKRVTFSRGYDVCLMAIDGTWRRDCQLNAISDTDATLTVEGSIQGLNLKQVLPAARLVYRPRLSPVRTRSRQRHRNGHPLPERQARQEEVGRLAEKRRGNALRSIRPRGRTPARRYHLTRFPAKHALALHSGEIRRWSNIVRSSGPAPRRPYAPMYRKRRAMPRPASQACSAVVALM